MHLQYCFWVAVNTFLYCPIFDNCRVVGHLAANKVDGSIIHCPTGLIVKLTNRIERHLVVSPGSIDRIKSFTIVFQIVWRTEEAIATSTDSELIGSVRSPHRVQIGQPTKPENKNYDNDNNKIINLFRSGT